MMRIVLVNVASPDLICGLWRGLPRDVVNLKNHDLAGRADIPGRALALT
jgi:hypothetical protein